MEKKIAKEIDKIISFIKIMKTSYNISIEDKEKVSQKDINDMFDFITKHVIELKNSVDN